MEHTPVVDEHHVPRLEFELPLVVGTAHNSRELPKSRVEGVRVCRESRRPIVAVEADLFQLGGTGTVSEDGTRRPVVPGRLQILGLHVGPCEGRVALRIRRLEFHGRVETVDQGGFSALADVTQAVEDLQPETAFIQNYKTVTEVGTEARGAFSVSLKYLP